MKKGKMKGLEDIDINELDWVFIILKQGYSTFRVVTSIKDSYHSYFRGIEICSIDFKLAMIITWTLNLTKRSIFNMLIYNLFNDVSTFT